MFEMEVYLKRSAETGLPFAVEVISINGNAAALL